MTRIKICGLTRVEDAVAADRLGADAIGLIFAPSPRRVSLETAHEIDGALSPWITRVGVFVDASFEEIASVLSYVPLDVVQLHGNEPPDFVREARRRLGVRIVKGIRVRDASVLKSLQQYEVDAFLLDTYVPGIAGGTGETFDWALAIPLAKRYPVILAGGLTPDNVAEAIGAVHPHGVDVSSGVESEPGIKDPNRMEEFVTRVRSHAVPPNVTR